MVSFVEDTVVRFLYLLDHQVRLKEQINMSVLCLMNHMNILSRPFITVYNSI